MALVLDGSTGIVSANIADGTISANDLASGAITSSALPAGSVLQVVTAQNPSGTTTSSATYVDVTGLAATITPSASTNKIIIRVIPKAYVSYNSERYPITYARILRNGSDVYNKGYYNYAGRAPNGYVEMQIDLNMEHFETAGTTSPLTYQVQFKTDSPVGLSINSGSTITLMEIAA